MRLVILKDLKITEEEVIELERQFTDLYYEHAGITPTFFVEDTIFSSYPTYVDSDGDIRPTHGFLKEHADNIYKRYGEFGTDHIVLLVHEDNWLSDTDTTKGIWGTNYSNIHHSYQLQYCRFDRDNMANSLGTLYHEVMHSPDVLIKTTTGFDIETLIGGKDWDVTVPHGAGVRKNYIRYKEQTKYLELIAPFLREAYAKRLALYQENRGLMETVISLIEKYLILYRTVHNKKDGVPRL